jgi:hypothetical protein
MAPLEVLEGPLEMHTLFSVVLIAHRLSDFNSPSELLAAYIRKQHPNNLVNHPSKLLFSPPTSNCQPMMAGTVRHFLLFHPALIM